MKATFDSERHEIVTHSFNRLTTIAALDIGSSKVCCVIARISRDQKISIAGYGYNASKGIKNGIITDIKQATYSVCDAVEAAEQMANERVSRIIVNISGDRVKSSIKRSAINLNKSKPVSEADIKKVIEKGINKINVENNELIHCLPTGYRLDFGEETNDPRNLYGESLSVDVLLGLVPEIMYRNVKTVLDNSHLEIAEKALSSYASGLACLVDDEKELGATVVDIGGGTTDIAVLSLGGKVKATSVRVAGNHYDEEILKFVRNKFSIAIGQRTAENLKKNVACCPQKADFNETMEIKGRSLLTGLPVRVNVSTADLYEPVMRLSEQIGTAAHQVLEKTPPELAGDIYRNGVVLTGGGAQLHGLPEYLSQELKVEVTVSPDPVNCVALGTAMSLRLGDKLETGFMDATPRMGRR